jgi:hypothetical protein
VGADPSPVLTDRRRAWFAEIRDTLAAALA